MQAKVPAPVVGLVVCATKAYCAGTTSWHSTAICSAPWDSPARRRLSTARSFHLEAQTCLMALHEASHRPSSHARPA